MRTKESKFSCRPALSILLMSLALLVGVICPQGAWAEEGDVFDALGFDESDTPDGYEADSAENPYGTNAYISANVVSEFSATRDVGNTLNNYDDVADGTSLTDFLKGSQPAVSTDAVPTASTYYRTGVAGDFNGDGLSGQTAYVSWSDFSIGTDGSTTATLLLYFVDPTTGTHSNPITLGTYSAPLGLGSSEAFWQGILSIDAGDFDGDGIDEVAVYIPENGNSRVAIYRYQDKTDAADDAWLAASNWAITWNHSIPDCVIESSDTCITSGSSDIDGEKLAPNMVSICAGDASRDGMEDLAISYGFCASSSEGSVSNLTRSASYSIVASKAVLLYGSASTMLQTSQALDLGSTRLARVGFSFGDLDGDDTPELVFGGQPMEDLPANEQRSVGVFSATDDGVVLLAAQTIQVVDYDETAEASNNGFDGTYCSRPDMISNVAVTTPLLGGSTFLYVDSVLYSYDSGVFSIAYELDDADKNGTAADTDASKAIKWICDDEITHYYSEYDAQCGDLDSSGSDALVTNYIGQEYERHANSYCKWEMMTGQVGRSYPSALWKHGTSANYTIDHCGYIGLYGKGGNLVSTGNVEAWNTYTCDHVAITLPDTDNDTMLLKYTGNHYLRYSDPQVYGVIASAPYFDDVATLDDNYLQNMSTSFTQTEGKGKSDIIFTDFEVGAFCDVETTFTTVETGAGFTLSYEESTTDTTEFSQSFSVLGGEDGVAFYSIPTEYYEYEFWIPDGNGGYTTTYDTVTRNFSPCVQTLTLDYYESIQGDYEALPQISGTAVSHTLGDPSSYPSSTSDLTDDEELLNVYDGDFAGVSFGNGSVSQEISTTSESEKSYQFGGYMSFRLGFGNDTVKGGGQTTINAGAGFANISMSGTTFGASVINMPESARDYGYYYSWKLLTYKYTWTDADGNENSFPVVTYLVNDVSAPPSLPTDFSQDQDLTTVDTNALTWTYDGTALVFDIYRYYDFPEGGGTYLEGQVSASDYVLEVGADGKYHKRYTFLDENLSEYTSYDYQIQVERGPVPPLSARSEVLSARTKSSTGYPDLSLSKDSVTVYPDRSEALTANVANITDYTGDKANYQWQRLVNGSWQDLDGKTSASITFSNAGTSSAGSYRCRVNVITKSDDRAISAYTDAASVSYSKRNVTLSGISISEDNSIYTRLSVDVASAHSDSGSIPGGTVSFTLTPLGRDSSTGVSYVYTAKLDDLGHAELDITRPFAGLYKVTAVYSGSRVFKAGEFDEAHYLCNTNVGYYLDAGGKVLSGDTVNVTLYKVTKSNGVVMSETVGLGQDQVQVMEGGSSVACDGKTFVTGDAVPHVVTVTAPDGSKLTVSVQVDRRPVTIALPNLSSNETSLAGVSDPASKLKGMVRLAGGSLRPSASGSVMDVVNSGSITVVCHDSAGRKVTSLDSPGMYTIDGSGTSRIYDITVIPGTYVSLGALQSTSASMRSYDGLYTGDLKVVSPKQETTTDGDAIELSEQTGTRLVFSAIPDSGYKVVDWYVNGVAQGSSSNSLTYTQKAETTTVEVQFAPIEYQVFFPSLLLSHGGVKATSNEAALSSGGIVFPGTEVRIVATPDEGYHVSEWRISRTGESTTYEPGTTAEDGTNTYTFTMGRSNVVVLPVFERDSYTFTYDDAGIAATYLGDADSDSTTPDVEIAIASGTSIPGDTEVTLAPKAGFLVDPSYVWYSEGSQGTVSSDGSTYTVTVTQDTSVSMTTIRDVFTGTFTASAGGTLTYVVDGGTETTITGETNDESVPGGSGVSVEATPNEGFDLLLRVSYDNGTTWADAGEDSLIIDAVGSHFIVEAQFTEKPTHVITLGDPGEGTYLYSVNGHDYENFAWGADHPAITVHHGDDVSIRIKPPTGQMVGYWKADKSEPEQAFGAYTFTEVVKDHTLVPTYTASTYCKVSWSGISDARCKLTLSPVDGSQDVVGYGGSFSFKLSSSVTFDAFETYTVKANGTELSPDSNGIYTVSDITENQEVTIAFDQMGLMVDGVDVAALSGDGWSYDLVTNKVTITQNDHTLSSDGVVGSPVAVVLDKNVSQVTLEDLEMKSSVPVLIEAQRTGGVTFDVVGECQLTQGLVGDNHCCVSTAGNLILHSVSNGSIGLKTENATDGSDTLSTIKCVNVAGGQFAIDGARVTVEMGEIADSTSYNLFGVLINNPSDTEPGLLMTGGSFKAIIANSMTDWSSDENGYRRCATSLIMRRAQFDNWDKTTCTYDYGLNENDVVAIKAETPLGNADFCYAPYVNVVYPSTVLPVPSATVTVSPATPTVPRSQEQSFSAQITDKANLTDETIQWSVQAPSGGVALSDSTTITADGLLSVGADEANGSLIVCATISGTTISGTTTVTLVNPATAIAVSLVDGNTVTPIEGDVTAIMAGKSARLRCTVTGDSLTDASADWVLSGNRRAATKIESVTDNGDGTYDAVIAIASDEISEAVYLTITSKLSPQVSKRVTIAVSDTAGIPAITTQPSDASVLAGKTATFSVVATGNPEPTYVWQVDRGDDAGWVDIEGATDPSYTTSAVTPENDGYKYQCVVANTWGKVVSSTAVLSVTARSLDGAQVTGIDDSYTYTGSEIAPAPVVVVDGATLVAGTDYEVTYVDNTRIGTATMTITGIGNYAGEIVSSFDIVKTSSAVVRLWGDTALDTMKKVVDTGFEKTGGTVILATSGGYWDALTASGVAGLADAPILLTDSGGLSTQTASALARLKPTKIVVCGGTTVVSDSVAAAAKASTGVSTTVVRCWGENAIETANDVLSQAKTITGESWSDTAFVVANSGYWDALSIAPYAYANGCPIALTAGAYTIMPSTITAMKDAGIKNFYVVGGTSVVGQEVIDALAGSGITFQGRLAGNDAVGTSLAVAEFEVANGMDVDNMALATTDGYWDALTGASMCGANNAPVILVNDGAIDQVNAFVATHTASINRAYIFGGTAAVSSKVESTIAVTLG